MRLSIPRKLESPIATAKNEEDAITGRAKSTFPLCPKNEMEKQLARPVTDDDGPRRSRLAGVAQSIQEFQEGVASISTPDILEALRLNP